MAIFSNVRNVAADCLALRYMRPIVTNLKYGGAAVIRKRDDKKDDSLVSETVIT